MRAHKVTAESLGVVLQTRYAATAALARDERTRMVEELEVKKSQVEIEQVEIPMAKAEFLEWLNELVGTQDSANDETEEEQDATQGED